MGRLLIPNTAQIPNVLFDKVMARVSPAQFKVLMAVARKTYGWGKESDRISLTQLQGLTGLSRQGVVDALAGLAWIVTSHQAHQVGQATEYSINIDSANELVNSVDQGSQVSLPEVVNLVDQGQSTELTRVVNSVDRGSQVSLLGVVNSVDTQNPILNPLTKPTNKTQEEGSAPAPALAFEDLGLGDKHPGRIAGVEKWQMLEEFWKSKHKSKSIYQLQAYGLKLLELKAQGHDPGEVVLKALRAGWMDLFGKEDTKASNTGATVVGAQELMRRARERKEKAAFA